VRGSQQERRRERRERREADSHRGIACRGSCGTPCCTTSWGSTTHQHNDSSLLLLLLSYLRALTLAIGDSDGVALGLAHFDTRVK